ncbi:MAG: polysaccharide biosynthesis/export family protein [Bryobacteraceae bacterium]
MRQSIDNRNRAATARMRTCNFLHLLAPRSVLLFKRSYTVYVYNREESPLQNLFSCVTFPRWSAGGLVNALCFFLLLCVPFGTGTLNAAQSGGEPPARTSDNKQPGSAGNIAAPGASVDTKTFKVGPQDVLKIIVWREPDFTGLYTVHSDGKITLPLAGDIQAGGLTAEEIQKNVAAALSKLIQKPNVTITVQQVLSQKYYMDGEIGRPGEYQLTAPTTVLEAISVAGGLRDFANGKKIYVLRGDKRIHFNYKDVIKGKNLEQNIQLQPGDHVIVP